MATVMFYVRKSSSPCGNSKHSSWWEKPKNTSAHSQVTEPEKGGMTAFAQAGIQIPVKPGSVLFWINTLSSGALDTMSYHTGCPVIFGHKRSKYVSHVYPVADPRVVPQVHVHHPLESLVGAPVCYLLKFNAKLQKFCAFGATLVDNHKVFGP